MATLKDVAALAGVGMSTASRAISGKGPISADAAARGIKPGDFVRVFNDRGEFHGDARVTEDTLPGVVVATLGYWRSRNKGGGAVNVISSDQYVNMGHAPSLSDNLVQVEAA